MPHSDSLSCRILIKIFIILIIGTQNSITLRCYSCGDENFFLKEKYPTPLPCEQMEDFLANKLQPQNISEHFIIECPEDYLGCITQIEGKVVMRSCDNFAIDDCKTANGITYCYCSNNLCNNRIMSSSLSSSSSSASSLATTSSSKLNKKNSNTNLDIHKSSRDINYPSDDEDYADGSGFSGNDENTISSTSKSSSSYSSSSSAILNSFNRIMIIGKETSRYYSKAANFMILTGNSLVIMRFLI